MDIRSSIFFLLLCCSISCSEHPDPIRHDQTPTTPNGSRRILFISDRATEPFGQIYVMNGDGSGQTRITQDSLDHRDPIVSPDGSLILSCSRSEDGTDDLFAMRLDGTGLRNVTKSPGDDHSASFSPDGSRIVFTSMRDGNPEIYLMDPDGGHLERKTWTDDREFAPQFIADGTKILYCRSIVDAESVPLYHLVTGTIAGDSTRCLTEGRSYRVYPPYFDRSEFVTSDVIPSVSNDGSLIVFTSYDPSSANMGILLMNGDGTDQRVVTWAPGFNVSPVFGVAPTTIIFRSHRDGKFDLFQTNVDGAYVQKLTVGVPGHVYLSEYSADGHYVLFTTDVGGYDRVWTMRTDGTEATQLTFASGNDRSPRYLR